MIAFASSKEAMQSQQKLANNPIVINLNKFHSKKAISSLKKKIVFITSAKSVSESSKFLKDTIVLKNLLPKTVEEFGDLAKNVKLKDNLIKDLQTISDFLLWADVYEHDDKNMKSLINNLKHSSQTLEHIVDYITIAIKSQEAINELKQSKASYTIEQIKQLIAA